MKPPRCIVCKRSFRSHPKLDFKLVYFKETELQKEKREDDNKKKKVGHPYHAIWFCEEHLELGRLNSHLTVQDFYEVLEKFGEQTKHEEE